MIGPLESAIWANTVVGYDTLTGAIQKLRKAFNDNPRHPRIIATLSKRGYRLIAAVQPLDKPPKPVQTRNVEDTSRWNTTPETKGGAAALLVILSVVAGVVFWFSP
ncbi:MAG: hypothetical protein GY807_15265 [Gammaproteobacteria bacterium]|nr:hypothetical protein [Gammaproteobacteria bacterium]